jgi:hypothetical protein
VLFAVGYAARAGPNASAPSRRDGYQETSPEQRVARVRAPERGGDLREAGLLGRVPGDGDEAHPSAGRARHVSLGVEVALHLGAERVRDEQALLPFAHPRRRRPSQEIARPVAEVLGERKIPALLTPELFELARLRLVEQALHRVEERLEVVRRAVQHGRARGVDDEAHARLPLGGDGVEAEADLERARRELNRAIVQRHEQAVLGPFHHLGQGGAAFDVAAGARDHRQAADGHAVDGDGAELRRFSVAVRRRALLQSLTRDAREHRSGPGRNGAAPRVARHNDELYLVRSADLHGDRRRGRPDARAERKLGRRARRAQDHLRAAGFIRLDAVAIQDGVVRPRAVSLEQTEAHLMDPRRAHHHGDAPLLERTEPNRHRDPFELDLLAGLLLAARPLGTRPSVTRGRTPRQKRQERQHAENQTSESKSGHVETRPETISLDASRLEARGPPRAPE